VAVSAVSQRGFVMVSPMMTKRLKAMLAALALAGLLAACGSDGGSSSGSDDVASVSGDDSDEQAQGDDQADTEEELLDWVECMRDEGIDIPDPTRDEDGNLVIDGPGIHLGGGDSEGSTSSDDEGGGGDEPTVDPEEMDAAMETCGEPPALGPSDISEEDRQEMEENALEFAECMRDEGIEDFPDPDFSNRGPGGEPQQRSSEDNGGEGDDEGPQVFLGPFGEIDLDDPDVRAAFEECQDLLGGPGLPPEPDDSGSDESSQT
jgi:predicted small lipoprotein YifL